MPTYEKTKSGPNSHKVATLNRSLIETYRLFVIWRVKKQRRPTAKLFTCSSKGFALYRVVERSEKRTREIFCVLYLGKKPNEK